MRIVLPLLLLGWLAPMPRVCWSDEPNPISLITDAIVETDDPEVQAALLRGMLRGLEGRRNVAAPPQWKELSTQFADSESQSVKQLSEQLSQIFGDAEAIRSALVIVQNKSAPANQRRSALRTLLSLQSDGVSDTLVELLDEPELKLDAIRGYSAIENDRAPQILLTRFAEADQETKRAIVETLATRKKYAEALLNALRAKRVAKQEIPAHVARSMSLLLGDAFAKEFGDVRQLGDDRQKLMRKYKELLSEDAIELADAGRGRLVFQKTCASCHVLYGEGAKIGPDLTGSNRANLDYILLNSIDPSYDVPEGYRMVLIQTVDGRLVNGVVAEEDAQRVVLKTVEQPMLVIPKDDIESRKVSPKSMMPDGQFDQLMPQEVIDLVKYLRTTEQVELPK